MMLRRLALHHHTDGCWSSSGVETATGAFSMAQLHCSGYTQGVGERSETLRDLYGIAHGRNIIVIEK